jgi:hypothetical protein
MATVTKGRTFTSGETVTPAKLNDVVDLATVTDIQTADIADGQVTDVKLATGIDASKLTTGTLPIARIADAAVTPAKLSQPLTLATAQATTSGTSIDFTGIPSWVKRITVMFSGVSTNGTANYLIQIGDSGGVETTGYAGSSGGTIFTNGFGNPSANALNAWHGALTISTLGSNTWVASGVFGNNAAATSNACGGAKTLSDTLDRIRLTTVNGTDTFDGGSVNIMYEG